MQQVGLAFGQLDERGAEVKMVQALPSRDLLLV